jgi:SAM-dependent methyltransferase
MISLPTLCLLLALAGVDEPACRAVADLEPEVSAGALETVASELAASGKASRWTATEGQTLRLKIRAGEPGLYEITLRAVPGPDGPTLSARVWSTTLARSGEATFALASADAAPLDVRLDPVALGPGYHLLDLECVAPGPALLDCVTLRRTGAAPARGERPATDVGEQGFLGVQLGASREGGVRIDRVVDDSAASRGGIEAGDVLLVFDGTAVHTADRLGEAISARRPGDDVEVVLLRAGERVTTRVELGRRPPEDRRERAAHVIEVLGVRPGQAIADIGCGSGWLAAAIAEAAGPEGTVYAVEIQARLVRRLHRRAGATVVPVLSAPDDVCLPADCLDTAMLHDVASHIDRDARSGFYRSLARALRPGGRVVVFGPHGRADSMLAELRVHGLVPVDADALSALAPADLDRRLEDGIVLRFD